MTRERLYLYDTTLRDGAQTQGVDFSLEDKALIAQQLDVLGIDYIEAGYPGANPTDTKLFAAPQRLGFAALTAFGAAVSEYYGTPVTLPGTVNVLDLREDIEQGQQVESFAVDAMVDGSWQEIARGTTIGHRRLLTLPSPITPADVRVRVLSSRAEAEVSLTVHFDPLLDRSGQANE